MGFKRPFDDEKFQELPCKHSRQLDVNNKLTQFQHVPCNNTLQKPCFSVEDGDGFHQHGWKGESESETVVNKFTNSVEKGLEISAALSLVTSSSTEEDGWSKSTSYQSLSLKHFGYDFPQRTFIPFDNSYSSLLDCSPKKQVHLGPNHQASLPSWDPYTNKSISDCKATVNDSSSNYRGSDSNVDNVHEEKLMGTCVIPMPDSNSSALNTDMVGQGITDCDCLDQGSVRCVQQHIMEAREKLLKSLGHEKFVKLGLCDMGEVVSCKWTEEEEQAFHDAVYSNPASLGRNFWKHLSAVFPSRTKKELVSYYFNVFMLQRRATQNRCYSLDIDSDDDEWHGSHVDQYDVQVSGEYEDSAIESPVVEEELSGSEKGCSDEDDDDGDDSDGDVGNFCADVTEEDFGLDYISQSGIAKSLNGDGVGSVVPHVDTITGRALDSLSVQDDSCTSFEFDMADYCGPLDGGHALQVSGAMTDTSKSLHGKLDGRNDLVGHVSLLDSCDAKVWDGRYISPIRGGVDLLPTCNIIEEIFGQGTWDTKTRYD
ncbi:uncharacterized protein LOC123216471 [Mangifera indica]|uniref:uncharacterized protein LOC123216471 n=1 Tax=Mangifera indica TaxID=29780 RepID=UPI001CFAFBAD|nr:uncharacterized protein LOC123216471 [Mangifera indica]